MILISLIFANVTAFLLQRRLSGDKAAAAHGGSDWLADEFVTPTGGKNNNMKFRYSLLIFIFLYCLLSCTEKNIDIRHIPYLTEINTVFVNGNLQKNRVDYFVIYYFNDSKKTKDLLNSFTKNYSDSFKHQYDNYSILLFKESKYVDTSYIKSFGENFYYKAVFDVKPDFIFQWWEGRLISK